MGVAVGASVGDHVGDSVGAGVGRRVGDSMGVAVGDSVGAEVGRDGVGEDVGRSDGAWRAKRPAGQTSFCVADTKSTKSSAWPRQQHVNADDCIFERRRASSKLALVGLCLHNPLSVSVLMLTSL